MMASAPAGRGTIGLLRIAAPPNRGATIRDPGRPAWPCDENGGYYDHVCSRTLDHTSVLELIEEKWNPASADPPGRRRAVAANR